MAGFADDAAGPDGRCAGATDDELIGILTAWQRLEAWAAAQKLAVIAELIRRRPGPGGSPGRAGDMPQTWGQFCADELAVATATSGQAADRALGLAGDLAARLPGTARALHHGAIDAYKARIIAEATRVLSDEDAAAAEALVMASGVAGRTPGQIRAAIARAVIRVNPDAARERREQAQRDARVQLWRDDAGTAVLCGSGLPPDEALAADQMISARARELRSCGLDGTMDQLRVRAYLDFLLGQDSRPAADIRAGEPGHQARADLGAPADAPPDVPGRADATAPAAADPRTLAPAASAGHPSARGAPAAGPAGRSGTSGFAARINLTIPLATLLGLAERPGQADGLGAIDPDLARTLATAAAGNPQTSWCVTVTDQRGHPTAHGCARPARADRSARSARSDANVGADGSGATGPGTSMIAETSHGTRDGFTFARRPDHDRPGPGDLPPVRHRTPAPRWPARPSRPSRPGRSRPLEHWRRPVSSRQPAQLTGAP